MGDLTKIAQEWISLTFGAVILFLLLAHYTGAEGILSTLGSADSEVIRSLQGPEAAKKK